MKIIWNKKIKNNEFNTQNTYRGRVSNYPLALMCFKDGSMLYCELHLSTMLQTEYRTFTAKNLSIAKLKTKKIVEKIFRNNLKLLNKQSINLVKNFNLKIKRLQKLLED